ncbi:MAG: nucleotide sugar dehydrogenase [Candidatus Magasanikbacteria bacterium]
MNILYIGSGFVGACSAAISAASGHKVLIYDIDENKIKMLSSGDRDTIESCLFEEGLGDMLVRNKERVEFTLDYKRVEEFLNECDAVFMCLPTPEIGETGESNLTYYFDAAEKLSQALLKRNEGKQEKYIVIVNKSTVPIDMVDKTQEIMDKAGVKNYGVVSNPEFLVEGKAVQGSLKPDRVVVGAWKEEDFKIMREVYERFYNSPTVSYIEINPKEAAASKLLANFYLAYKLVACYDVIGRACETFEDLKFENIRNVLTTDKRIGNWGFFDSLYAGGSCLVKDIRSLSHQLQTSGTNASLVNEIYQGNKRQLELFISRAKEDANFDWKDKKVALLGVAFKRDTNDIRNSPSIDIVHFLNDNSISEVRVFDPAAMEYFKQVFPESETIKYKNNEIETLQDCDVVIVSTDWPQFKSLGDYLVDKLKDKKPLIMDGRRILQHRFQDLQNAGFDIIAVGSPFMKGIRNNK